MASRSPAAAAPVDLAGRTVVVTGASTGSLGYTTAQLLASWGAHVVVTTRSGTDAVVAQLGDNVTGHELDLCDAASVAAFTKWLTGERDRIDVLVNNAGVHLDLRSNWTEPKLTPDGHEIHWRTNYLGTAHLTHLLLPSLRATATSHGEARVVNVVSKLHNRADNAALFEALTPYNSWTAYGASKLALIHHANEIERRYADAGLHGYSLHPGSVYTTIADKGLAENRVLSAIRRAFAPLERRMLLSPVQGAQTTLYCATEPDLPGGTYYRNCSPAPASEASRDTAAAARLWDMTEDWIRSL